MHSASLPLRLKSLGGILNIYVTYRSLVTPVVLSETPYRLIYEAPSYDLGRRRGGQPTFIGLAS